MSGAWLCGMACRGLQLLDGRRARCGLRLPAWASASAGGGDLEQRAESCVKRDRQHGKRRQRRILRTGFGSLQSGDVRGAHVGNFSEALLREALGGAQTLEIRRKVPLRRRNRFEVSGN